MSWYLEVLKKYAVFEGRARRKEYWVFALVNLVITVALMFVDGAVGTIDTEVGLGVLSGVYTLLIVIPGLAVTIRRLHDTDRSGWWWLISLIPLIGPLILLVFLVGASDPDENRFGANPIA